MSTEERNEFELALERALESMGISVDGRQREKMYLHYQQVVQANRQFNLTRITAPADAAVKHYADSLSILATGWFEAGKPLTVLDVGTGAGFPAVPLAIACPEWMMIAIDGTGKKVRFVGTASSALGISNLLARHARVEDLTGRDEPRFDLVLVRAVGKIAQLLPSLAAVTKPGGSIVFYKAAPVGPELEDAAPIAAKYVLRMSMSELELPVGAERLARRLVRYQRCG